MKFDELKEQYDIDITLEEEMIDRQCISLPKVLAKYQFFYHDLLNEITTADDNLRRMYHEMYVNHKMGNGDLKNLTLNATELKQLLESSIVYREVQKKMSLKKNQLLLVEEMIENLKSIRYSVNNYLTYKKIMYS